MATQTPIGASGYVIGQLHTHAKALEATLAADLLTFVGPIAYGADDAIKDALEMRQTKREKIAVILETDGGYIEVAERIANMLRYHYNEVIFIIPNFAMSAGTVLVMSGDAIYMDYYSILGPIDPQIDKMGQMVPALGYLEKYDEFVAKSKSGALTQLEAAYFIERFDPGELHKFEEARELSISLLKEWLVNYKFKNWKKTKTRGKRVTNQMRVARAARIARDLNKTKRWHSHGRGLSMQVLSRDLALLIDDFGVNQKLRDEIKMYYNLLKDYMGRVRHRAVVDTIDQYKPLLRA